MRYLLLCIVLPIFAFAQTTEDTQKSNKWLTDYTDALRVAKKENKNIIAYFTGSDWCPPCKKLKTDLFDSEEFIAIADDYVLLYIDIPMNKDLLSADQLQHNKELSARLNKKKSVPLIKILNKKGKELDKYSGYSMNGNTSYHLKMLKKHQ